MTTLPRESLATPRGDPDVFSSHVAIVLDAWLVVTPFAFDRQETSI